MVNRMQCLGSECPRGETAITGRGGESERGLAWGLMVTLPWLTRHSAAFSNVSPN